MKDEITGIMAIFIGIFFFIKRDHLVNTLIKQKEFGEKKLGVTKYKYMSSESYFQKLIVVSSIFCVVISLLTFFGVLHAK